MLFDWVNNRVTEDGLTVPMVRSDIGHFDFVRCDTGESQNDARHYDTESQSLCKTVRHADGLMVLNARRDGVLEKTERVPCEFRDKQTGDPVSPGEVRDYVLDSCGEAV